MNLFISDTIRKKLKEKHKVDVLEVQECFDNRASKKYARETRSQHEKDETVLWFLSKTNSERLLKVVFIRYSQNDFVILSAYEPNDSEVKLWNEYMKLDSSE